MMQKLCKRFLPKISLCLAAMLVLFIMVAPMVAGADDNDNFSDLWDSTVGQYEKIFPIPEMLYIFLLMVLSIGTYMKTNSLGAVTALLVIGGVLLAGAVGDLGKLVFGFALIISIAFLIYMAYRRR